MAERQPPAHIPSRLTVEPLTAHHDRAAFSCGTPELDTYLLRLATQHHRRDVSRIFVLVPAKGSSSIMGYYTLSNYSIVCNALPAELAKGLPSSILLPATLLGRLAVDERYQSQGLGKRLLLHALREALRATRTSASLGVVVDAMTDELVDFYTKRGFVELLDKPRHLIIPMNRIRALFPEEAGEPLDAAHVIREAAAAAAIIDELSALLLAMGPDAGGEHLYELMGQLQRHLDMITGQDT